MKSELLFEPVFKEKMALFVLGYFFQIKFEIFLATFDRCFHILKTKPQNLKIKDFSCNQFRKVMGI